MTARQVKCPHCGRFALYSTENKFRPFCSERCRLIDLGQWASESYRIAKEDHHVDFDEEQLPEDDSE